jgi:hypothetical protein
LEVHTLNDSTNSLLSVKKNLVRLRVTIRGERPLLQYAFGESAIPLEKQERSGVAGNDPEEWRRTMMVTGQGQLYLRAANVFACIRNASKHTKRGRGSQAAVAATLQVEESVILLNRWLPKEGDPTRDVLAPVYIDVAGVRNPNTKGRNVRYRLAAGPGWECSFTLRWDKTLVSRPQMQAILRDAAILEGICDGRSIGNGRFEIVAIEELTNAEETTAEGSVEPAPADRLDKGPKAVRPLPNGAQVD